MVSEMYDPIENATIILEQTGEYAVSDAVGSWTISTDFDAPAVTLEVQSESTVASTQVTELPKGPKDIEVTLSLSLSLNRSESDVSVTRQVVRQKPPSPTPTRTPTATAIPKTLFTGTIVSSN